jgi:hypothetical protein
MINLTLDEAIKHCKEEATKEKSCGNDACAEEHLQLAVWLEELKQLRSP